MKVKIIDEKTKADKQFLNNIKREAYDFLFTTSTEAGHIDLEHAKRIGLTIKTNYYKSELSVAQHYFTLLLQLCSPTEKNKGIELYKKQLGIIGYGRIGKHCEKIANGFGMKVKKIDIDTPKKESIKIVRNSFALFLCLRWKGEYEGKLYDNTNFFSNKNFGLIVRDNFFIPKLEFVVNCARSSIVDDYFMAHLLKNGIIRKYAVDGEPNLEIYKKAGVLNKLVVTPHIAWKTIDCFNRRKGGVEKIKEFGFV